MTEFKAKLGIICAMDIELAEIKKAMDIEKEECISGVNFVLGTFEGKKTAAAVCGVGKVFAALCTEAMILNYAPEVIINSGVAGGISPTLKICDAVVAKNAVQYDMDTSALGDPVGMLSGINIVYIPCDEATSQAIMKAAQDSGINTEYGTVVSGDKFVSSNEEKRYIGEAFSAKACEMEGASVAHVCYVNKTKCAILRTISDGGNDEAFMDFPTFAAAAAKQSFVIMKKFAGDLL